jgi:sec-independent protein translocase protein TatC
VSEVEEGLDETKAPLLDHLVELRRRLIWSAVALALSFGVCIYFVDALLAVLVRPLIEAGQRQLIAVAVFEQFFVRVKIAFFGAMMISFPVLASQIWLFVAPGLYRQEKRAFLPFLVATPFMFYAGCAIMYYVVLPYVINFMLTQYAPPDIEKTLRSSDYLERILQLVFAFGFAFEMPVLLILLIKVGITSSEGLRSKRRYAIVICFVVAAVLAPPDVVSQIALAIPLLAFYEISIIVGSWIEKKREEEDKKAEEADGS